ncbi:uncharacterized protein LOC131844506 [Achroia grisella]|uniref:uncharacterized protein LOC131844506 n=1 Tax=Achroia grisella TaxID=688607 RepID=UPI0027D2BEA9|nr:uncharacterized protein LOC131844506 [Achroia grisella]
MWRFLTLSLMASVAEVVGTASPYCSVNTFTTSAAGLQFTKEPVPVEYGFEEKFKSIHCCVKGYRSIEWFKNGTPYPWSAGVSNLILYPEDANQTLYTGGATRADSGNYTCRISNETHSDVHTITLDVLDKPIDRPRTMFISKDQWLDLGDELRLFCEALVGKSYLADALSDLRWRKISPNGTIDLLPTQNETKTYRDDINDIRGSYMRVARVTLQDFGTYACEVRSNGAVVTKTVTVHYRDEASSSGAVDAVPGSTSTWGSASGVGAGGASSVPWRALALGAACAAAVLVSAAALHRRCSPRLLLAARQLRARAAGPAHRARVLEKEFDVVVCWTPVDAELVRGALLPTLTLKYKYRVHTLQLSTMPDNWYNEMSPELARCRSLLAVVSPSQYTPQQLLEALRQLRALPLSPVVVLLQDLPKLKREAKESGARLVEVVRGLRLLAWRHVLDRTFWRELRPLLPLPPSHYHHDAHNKMNSAEKSGDPTHNSGSLTALV